MDSYCDLRIRATPDVSTNFILSRVYSNLHLALVDRGQREIGVSFPNHEKTLGDVIRLHGKASSLALILEGKELLSFQSYLSVSQIMAIPKNVSHRVVKRVQPKTSAERLRRRSVRKGWLTPEEAQLRIPDIQTPPKLPFVHLRSHTTGQEFRLFIFHGELQPNEVIGEFTCYGLSCQTTIPWF